MTLHLILEIDKKSHGWIKFYISFGKTKSRLCHTTQPQDDRCMIISDDMKCIIHRCTKSTMKVQNLLLLRSLSPHECACKHVFLISPFSIIKMHLCFSSLSHPSKNVFFFYCHQNMNTCQNMSSRNKVTHIAVCDI